ncbi:MAG: folylpolyglutamate synthase/dihydrofolate synthase family protein [Acidobacteriota bacterium]
MVAKSYTFQESLDYLLSLGNEVSAMKLGLENIRTLLAAIGDPQNDYLKVQVAGTNGKGSVCAFLDSICNTAEIKAGLYTSPHLITITERIKISGNDISEFDFARVSSIVRDTALDLVAKGGLEYTPTFFEQVTAIALLAFAEAKVDLAILETGLGGRLDATTAAHAEIAAITRIDYDHQQYLGETIEDIAAEKAAIIHEGSKVVIGAQPAAAMQVLLDRCRRYGITPEAATKSYLWVQNVGSTNKKVVEFHRASPPEIGVTPGLIGRHQIENAHTAIMVACVLTNDLNLDIDEDQIRRGIEDARHPGRLDWREYSGHRILLDGAHNAGGAKALADYLATVCPDARITLVFGLMDDKDVNAFTTTLFPMMENIIFTRPGNPRAADPAELAEHTRATFDPAKVFVVPDIADALAAAVQITASYGATRPAFTCITGSLYLVGEVLALIPVIHG